jgi:ABC-type lipoprotein release transport system permease subunit
MLFGVDAIDPAMFAITAGALTVAAVAAACIPAHRASRIDPGDLLR